MLPCTCVVLRYGARAGIGSMAIAWGILGSCHALIRSRTGFYTLRCLLGMSQGAATSSGGHLLAQFWPQSRLAMPFSVVFLSQVISPLLAGPMSAGILAGMEGTAGLHGYQCLFIIQSAPSVLLGIAMWVWLPSHPLSAWMLTPEEREAVHLAVHATGDQADKARSMLEWSQMPRLVLDVVRCPMLWFFVLVGCFWGTAAFSMLNWLPILVQNMLSGTALQGSTSSGLRPGAYGSGGGAPVQAILLTSIPSLTAAAAMMFTAWHADRTREKVLHVGVPHLLGGVVLACFQPIARASFAAGFANLVVGLTAANSATGVLSSRAMACLETSAVGAGLAVYTMSVCTLSGIAGPVIVGMLVQKLHSFAWAVSFLAASLMAGGLLMLGLYVWERRRAAHTRPGPDQQLPVSDVLASDCGSMPSFQGSSEASAHSSNDGDVWVPLPCQQGKDVQNLC